MVSVVECSVCNAAHVQKSIESFGHKNPDLQAHLLSCIDSKLFRECKDPSSCSIQVKLLPSMAPDSLFAPRVDGCALSLLTKSSQEEAEEVALCNICGEARSASGFQYIRLNDILNNMVCACMCIEWGREGGRERERESACSSLAQTRAHRTLSANSCRF